MAMMTLSFAKESCACSEPLFSYKYLRTYRANNLKLIRCFPHCCPTHSYGALCTSSIDLRLAGATPDLTNLIAFVRFQSMQDPMFEPGEKMNAQNILANLRSPENPHGEWIPGAFVTYDSTKEEIIFQFNRNNSIGWHYGWVGLSTQAHRACLHRLVGYIAQYASPSDKSTLRIVQTAASPPFIVMSYRRACYFCQKHRPDGPGEQKTECECEGEFNYKRSLTNYSGMNLKLTQAKESATNPVDIERHLTILFAFLAMPSVHFYSSQLPTLQTRILKSLLQPLGSSLSLTAYQRRVMTFPMSIIRPGVSSIGPVNTALESLKALCLDLFLSVMTYGSLQQTATYFSANARRLFDRDALYETYEEWIRQTHRMMVMRLLPMRMTMTQLTNHILLAAAQIPQLSYLGSFAEDMEKKIDEHSPGFDFFVAQMREVYMAGSQGTVGDIPGISSSSSGRWMYDKTISVVYADSVSPELDFSLITLLKSDLYSFNSIWSELELDGRPHIFRVFPNGESTMTPYSSLLHGDYIARKSQIDGSIWIDLLSWPLNPPLIALHVNLLLQTVKEQTMTISLTIKKAEVPDSVDWVNSSAAERYASYPKQSEYVIANIQLRYSRVK
ncbi:hypothetical protein AeRB84_020671 [Aphanomyces euteiches]|nr:hypothetical protein AeRB84_020671 [Aphanomyces euteiches]